MITNEEESLMLKALEHAFLNNGYIFGENDFLIIGKISNLNLDDLIYSISKCLAFNHNSSQNDTNVKASFNIMADYLKVFSSSLQEFKLAKLFLNWHRIDHDRANDLQYKFLLK